MKEMVGGCCVCSDDRGWAENPLVYCDGPGCTVAVHQACYGIVTVPTGNWYCRKCEVQERNVKVRCELCPNKDGALKPTDNNAWAHVVCALYIPEVRFGNVTTMEPIILAQIPQERYNKTCYICEESNRVVGRSTVGACMQCNKAGCKQQFHVTCAQGHGLLCEEAGHYMDNVKYCGYCHHHYTKLKKTGNVKIIPPYRPATTDSPESSPLKESESTKATSKRKLRGSRTPPTTATTGVSPAGSPRPITPQNPPSNVLTSIANSAGTSQISMNPVVSIGPLTGINIPLASSHSGSTTTTLPPTTTTSAGGLPGQVSAAAIVASSASSGALGSSGNPTPVVVEPKRPSLSGVLKETRPNSIVVNVPLEVVMPTSVALTNNPVPVSSPSLLTITDPISPPLTSVSSQMDGSQTQLQMSTSSVPAQQAPPPVKRVRSHSSEKSDNSKSLPNRRASKRGSTSSSSSSASAQTSNSVVMGLNPSKSISPSPNLSHPSVKTESQQSSHMSSLLTHNQLTPQQNHLPSPASLTINANNSMMINHLGGNETSGKSRKQPAHGSVSSNHMPAPIKEEKDVKLLSSSNAPHMLGNQLNPTSTMAQKMCDTLSQEMVAHSVFNTTDSTTPHVLVGPQPPRISSGNAATNNTTNNHAATAWTNSTMPQTLEQLLERQWEQGSQFLMEQAQHFDIASLLSCLHQLRAENAQLEEHVNSLVQRRDHLLAVNARLAIPLVSTVPVASSANATVTTNTQQIAAAPIVENGLPSTSPHPQEFRSNMNRQQQGNGQNQSLASNSQFPAQNSVLVRTNSVESSRRSSQSPASGVYANSTTLYQQNPSPQLQSQSQVVMRRGDVITDLNQQQQSQLLSQASINQQQPSSRQQPSGASS